MKLIKYSFLIMLVGALVIASCQNSKPSNGGAEEPAVVGVHFKYHSIKEALEADEGKPLFIDCYADWCGPCRMLDERVFPKKEVGDLINKNFTPVKLDADSPEGQAFSRKFGIRGLPTMVMLKNKEEVHRIVGFHNASQLKDEVQIAIDKM